MLAQLLDFDHHRVVSCQDEFVHAQMLFEINTALLHANLPFHTRYKPGMGSPFNRSGVQIPVMTRPYPRAGAHYPRSLGEFQSWTRTGVPKTPGKQGIRAAWRCLPRANHGGGLPTPVKWRAQNPVMQSDRSNNTTLSEFQVRPVERHEEPRYKELMAQHHYLGDLTKIGETIWYVALWGEHWEAPAEHQRSGPQMRRA